MKITGSPSFGVMIALRGHLLLPVAGSPLPIRHWNMLMQILKRQLSFVLRWVWLSVMRGSAVGERNSDIMSCVPSNTSTMYLVSQTGIRSCVPMDQASFSLRHFHHILPVTAHLDLQPQRF